LDNETTGNEEEENIEQNDGSSTVLD